jgi:hypothetical protein
VWLCLLREASKKIAETKPKSAIRMRVSKSSTIVHRNPIFACRVSVRIGQRLVLVMNRMVMLKHKTNELYF